MYIIGGSILLHFIIGLIWLIIKDNKKAKKINSLVIDAKKQLHLHPYLGCIADFQQSIKRESGGRK